MLQNLLRHETSPYLLQHQSNPVHWRPWGSAAIAEARREDKPILLSIGYAACHWCHVMAHESFEDEATAAVMNRLFVNIKVDREERPDVDQIYMAALHAIGEQGGWPLTMFLTPDGQPIWGGTYFPKTARYGRPAFVDILTEVARIYREEPDKVRTNRAYIMDRLNKTPDPAGPHLDRTLLDQAAERLLGFMDGVNGGVRGAPKFPQASLLELLWRSGLRTGRRDFIDAVTLTLRRLSEGGIYDHLGGGFARYSVDDRWLVPHFEKMLYDNAQLIELMTYAASTTDAPLFKARISETIDWLARDMTSPSGAFAASIDADSDGHEGKFYVWTLNEILEVLGPAVGPFFADFYDVRPEGNWEDASILNQLHHTAAPSAGDQSRAAESRQKLLARRNTRIPPAIDDKILADWNGLAIAALALAGAVHDRSDWVTRAAAAFGAVRDTMTTNGRLAHSWCAGKATYPGLATDYAAMIKAALALFTATLDVSYAHQAEAFAEMVRRHHFDSESSGYYLSADDAEDLIVRPRSVADEATPSANSLMAANLVRLWRITGNDQYRAEADALLAASGAAVAANLFAGAGMLSALDLRLGAIDVVLVRPPHAPVDDMVRAVHANLSPNIILTVHDEIAAVPTEHPAFGKRALDGRVTAYVCRGETCSLPVNDPAALAAMLLRPPSA